MVKFINRRTGSSFWVADDKVEEYKAAGHKLAAESRPVKPKEEAVQEEKEEVEEVKAKRPLRRAKK